MLFSETSQIIEFIFERWKVSGLSVDVEDRQHAIKCANAGMALGDRLLSRINEHIQHYLPADIHPDWLSDIDEFFNLDSQISKSAVSDRFRHSLDVNGHLRQSTYIGAFTLLTPIIYLDQLLAMKSFTDSFLQRFELAFLSRINAPRNVHEAQRLYDFILSLPKEFINRRNGKPYLSPQPYKAQMFFVVLMWAKAVKKSQLWSFQRKCVEACPEYLLDYPDISKKGFTYRPAFWMARVSDPDFRHIVTHIFTEI